MKPISQKIKEKPWLGWVIFIGTVVVVFLIGLLGSSIIERRGESVLLQTVKPIADFEPNSKVWGEIYPREYDTYLQMKDTNFASKYNGSATVDELERNPDLVILWDGYAFSRMYTQSRGHYYAVNDISKSLRTGVPQPGTCWTCKSTDVPRLINQLGAEQFYHTPWNELGSQIKNTIGCQDCHNPKTMNLKITRPALTEAFQRQGENIEASGHNDMRSLVCAQCHVEYHFKGDGKYLTIPWDKGMKVDAIEKYYDSVNFTDWVHPLSKAPMLKAQHPDYEIFTTSVHYDRGLSCEDCHMPYRTEGGVKFTDHHVQSPLNNVENSCMVCHRVSKEELVHDVYEREEAVMDMEKEASENLVKTHLEAKAAWDAGATEEEMKPVLLLIRHSQWRWDFVAASHGAPFHSPLECSKILNSSIEKSMQARLLLSGILTAHNVKQPIPMPDISTKEKAQAFIGLDMKKLWEEKTAFIKDVLPNWGQKYPDAK